MSGCPVRPAGLERRQSLWKHLFSRRPSWLHVLSERSYSMKMGEVRLPGAHIFMLNQPELVRRVLVDEPNDFPKHSYMGEIMAPLMGESIFTTNAQQWRRQRDLLNPSFELTRIQHVFSLMQTAAEQMLQRFAQLETAPSIDVDREMGLVAADIIFRTILSVSIEQDDAREIFDAFAVFQREVPKTTMKKVFRIPTWIPIGWRGERRRLHAAGQIRAALERVIRPRYEAAQSSQTANEQDILASMLSAIDPDTGARFSFAEIVDQVATMFLAGHESSASALTWSLYLLALNPDVQERLHDEVTTALNGEPISAAALKKMPLARDVFRESLRLYPPVGFFARESANATCMRNKAVPEDATIVISPWLIHRHRSYWDAPDDFDPGRYAKARMKMPLRDCFLPFSMGPRVCIGAGFAMQEAVLVLATLVSQYRFSMAAGFEPIPVARLTTRSDNGMHLVFSRR